MPAPTPHIVGIIHLSVDAAIADDVVKGKVLQAGDGEAERS